MAVIDRGPVVIRRRLGSALKQLRARTGLHLDVVAKELEVSPAKVSRLETGQVAPKLRDVRDLLALYDAPEDERDAIMQWADEARGQGWWQPVPAHTVADLDLFISLEAEAARVKVFTNITVPGLLQNHEYARVVLEGAVLGSNAIQLDQLVDIRQRRQAVLNRDPRGDVPPLELHAIVDEAALRRGPSDSPIMIDQLHRMLKESKRPKVTIQAFPESEGFGPAHSPFAVFEPRLSDDGIVVNVESTGHDGYYDTKSEIDRYLAMWDDLASRAREPEATRDMIRAILKARGATPID